MKKEHRLTARNNAGNPYYPYCFREDTCNGLGTGDCTECEHEKNVLQRLAEYEDTGLSPAEILRMDKMYRMLAEELARCKEALAEMEAPDEAD